MKRNLSRFFAQHPAISFGCIMVLFISIQSIFSFCTKPECGGFINKQFDDWFPYKGGQVLLFDNSQGFTDTIEISTVYKQDPYKSTRGCKSRAWVNTKNDGPWEQLLNVDAFQSDSGDIISILVRFKQLNIEGFTLSDTGITGGNNRTHTSRFHPAFTLGTKTYANVQELLGDTTGVKQDGIFRFWLAKGKGIVGYEVFPSLDRYVLR